MTINFASVTYDTMITNFSKTLSRTPVTKTVGNISGDETLSDGTPVNILGAFFRKEDSWSQDKEGLFQGADSVLMVKSTVTINKDDKLTYTYKDENDADVSQDYRVDKVIARPLGTTFFYKVARCFLI